LHAIVNVPHHFFVKRRENPVMSHPWEISPTAAKTQLNATNKCTLLDVREPNEWAVAHIEGALLVPMGSVPQELPKLEEMADQGDLLVVCHHGVRSLQVVAWLRAKGIENCYSVTGGIDRWSTEVDESVPRY
jgi:rhodanese-related sulfurtransferase